MLSLGGRDNASATGMRPFTVIRTILCTGDGFFGRGLALNPEIALQNLRLRLDFLGRPLMNDMAVVDDVDPACQR